MTNERLRKLLAELDGLKGCAGVMRTDGIGFDGVLTKRALVLEQIVEAARAVVGAAEPNGDGIPTDGQLLDQLQDAFYAADAGYVEQDVELRKTLANVLVKFNKRTQQ